jgi:hypothetical protein
MTPVFHTIIYRREKEADQEPMCVGDKDKLIPGMQTSRSVQSKARSFSNNAQKKKKAGPYMESMSCNPLQCANTGLRRLDISQRKPKSPHLRPSLCSWIELILHHMLHQEGQHLSTVACTFQPDKWHGITLTTNFF